MNILRFEDLVAQGKAAGQRVFIRADLNVPQDDAGHITEDTRIRASVPAIQACLDAGMDDHVAKPVVAEQLFSTLHYWLSGQRATLKGSRRAPPATP